MVEEHDKKNNFSYYFKLLIKLIIFVVSIYYIYKYRTLIRRYISLIDRWFRFSSPLRNVNARFRNWQERGRDEIRRPLLDQIEREFEEAQAQNLQRGAGLAAAASGGYLANATRDADGQLEDQTETPIRRSGRIPNWTGPIKERAYAESRANTLRANEVNLERKRADGEAVANKTGGSTIPYLKKWLAKNGYAQPEFQNLQDYWDLVLGRTELKSLDQPRQPLFIGESSSEPLVDNETLENMYLQRSPSSSDMLYQPPMPPNFLDRNFKPVDFGRSKRRNNRR
jgi:hypothetical protein